MSAISSALTCSGCGYTAEPSDPAPFRCARAGTDGGDHVLRRRLEIDSEAAAELRGRLETAEESPFLRFRELLHSYRSAVDRGISDAEYRAIVADLDARVAAVDGAGIRETPFTASQELADALEVAEVWVKDETGNVSGSHKARHLFGLLLWLRSAAAVDPTAPLAIASCGNAALGAAVVARAARRRLDVFVPPHADPAVLDRLRSLGSRVRFCERRSGEVGDPCFLRFREELGKGALPFTCQGSENGLTIDGGKTLAWEMAARLSVAGRTLDRLFVQVGGGALATACIEGLSEARQIGLLERLPRIHAVQTRGAHPLERAWERIVDRLLDPSEEGAVEAPVEDSVEGAEELVCRLRAMPEGRITDALAHAASHRSEYMWPWETEPRSVASGILDDETYDWLAVVEGMLETGGYPVTVSEAELIEANEIARAMTGSPVDHTGSAGLAAALRLSRGGALGREERVGLLFTGAERG